MTIKKLKYPIFCIVAMNENRIIGDGKNLLWHLPGDLKRLKKTISKKIFFLDRLDDLNLEDKKFVLNKLELLQSPYKQLKSLKLEIPKIMGILNVTPDSFSDGGKYDEPAYAFKHFKQMISEGADMIDIGGESTRPGSKTVAVKKEIARILPVLKKVKTLKKNIKLLS